MLDKEIDDAKRLVRTDAYQMSIGEIVSNYKEGELLINPDFQPLFRWEIGQKSRFVESLLLGVEFENRRCQGDLSNLFG